MAIVGGAQSCKNTKILGIFRVKGFKDKGNFKPQINVAIIDIL